MYEEIDVREAFDRFACAAYAAEYSSEAATCVMHAAAIGYTIGLAAHVALGSKPALVRARADHLWHLHHDCICLTATAPTQAHALECAQDFCEIIKKYCAALSVTEGIRPSADFRYDVLRAYSRIVHRESDYESEYINVLDCINDIIGDLLEDNIKYSPLFVWKLRHTLTREYVTQHGHERKRALLMNAVLAGMDPSSTIGLV